MFKRLYLPLWVVWLSWLSTGLWTEGSPVPFPVRAQAWVAGQVPSRGHSQEATTHWCYLSLSFSLPSPPSKYKYIKSFKKINNFIYSYLERGKGREGETPMWEKNSDRLPLVHVLIRDQICTLAVCPDRELNQQPLALQIATQPTEPHQSRWERKPAYNYCWNWIFKWKKLIPCYSFHKN